MAIFQFDNSYARLPDVFFRPVDPTPVKAPQLLRLNTGLAQELGLDLDGVDEQELARIFSGNQTPEGADPLAMAYAGHQFGNFVPQLGDGRAVLLGEVIDNNHCRRDIQLKGAGRTPFSRSGDGRSPLGPVLREYLVSEAMHALGVPTTRALAAVSSGEGVMREYPQPGAVMCRVAKSHIRVGTFQYFAARDDRDSLAELADYVIARHYPEVAVSDNRYLDLLQKVIERQAKLVAHWMSLGFIHGVMNTDNVAVAGETIDYGPCAFMDRYDPGAVFSAIDTGGRYAFGNQPVVAQWNLARFAETLLPLLAEDQDTAIDIATKAVHGFMPLYDRLRHEHMQAKLGLFDDHPSDVTLLDDLLAAMVDNKVDFTLLFRRLAEALESPEGEASVRALFANPDDWDQWFPRWQQRLQAQGGEPSQWASQLRTVNPAVIPRNHRVEQAITAAVDEGDFTLFHQLAEDFRNPFTTDTERDERLGPPGDREKVFRTFCGT